MRCRSPTREKSATSPFSSLAEQIGRAMIRLNICNNLLDHIVAGSIVEVKVSPKFVGIVADAVVDSSKLIRYKAFLKIGIEFGVSQVIRNWSQ